MVLDVTLVGQPSLDGRASLDEVDSSSWQSEDESELFPVVLNIVDLVPY